MTPPRRDKRQPNRSNGPQRAGGRSVDRGSRSQPRNPRPSGPMSRRPDRPKPHPSRGYLNIIHEDADILVVEKPKGLITASPTPTSSKTLFDSVKDYVRKQRGRRARAWIIHRLDQDASGLVVFAVSERAFDKLKDDLQARRIHRLYVAVVEGEFPAAQNDRAQATAGTIQTLIRENREGDVEVVPGDRPMDAAARPAVTHYRVEATGTGMSLLRVRLETGRKHQIRVHLASIDHPIVGDRRYGSKSNPLRRLALHAAELRFTHPTTGDAVHLVAPAPDDFYHAVGAPVPKTPAPKPAARSKPVSAVGSAIGRGLDTSWQGVSDWYDEYQKGGRSDHFSDVILPGAISLMGDSITGRVLDLACGEGSFASALASHGATVVGVDAATNLVAAAAARRTPRTTFLAGDARKLDDIDHPALAGPFDAVTCVMAMMNIDPLSGFAEGAAKRLTPGGIFAAVILHPAFRSPKRSSWGWDGRGTGGRSAQYRRIDGYLSHGAEQIVMNPGEVASGAKPVITWTFHRPIEHYVRSLSEVGLLVEAIEEWPSRRTSQPGPRAEAENRARREIPMFLGIRARFVPRTQG